MTFLEIAMAQKRVVTFSLETTELNTEPKIWNTKANIRRRKRQSSCVVVYQFNRGIGKREQRSEGMLNFHFQKILQPANGGGGKIDEG